jgi:hypothetical protein
MKRVFAVLGLIAVGLVFAAVAASAPTNEDELLKDEKYFLEQAKKSYTDGAKAGSSWNMEVVAHNDLDGRGFNADVWAHEGYAYIGHWGFADWSAGSKTRFCPEYPNNGVAIVDSRTNLRVATLQNPAGTSAEDVVVYTAPSGPSAERDIAVVGLQWCSGSRFDINADRGLMLWDVTNPAFPSRLGYLRTACCTRGVHEFEVAYREDLGRTFAYATVPTSRYPDPETASGVRDENGNGDFRLIDITNPSAPTAVSDWGVWADLGSPPGAPQGCDPDPPSENNPVKPSQRGTLSQTAQVWGVVVEDGLIYASDMNTGLWVLRRK